MIAIIFALLAYVGFATGDFFNGIISRKIGPYSTTFWLDLITVVILSLCIPFFGSSFSHVSLPMVLLSIFLSLFGTLGFIFFLHGFEKGNASIVSSISGSFIAPVVLLSVVFLKQAITAAQVITIVLIFLGLILTSLEIKAIHKKDFSLGKGVLQALIAMLLWSVFFTFITIPIEKMGWFWTLYFSYFPFVVTYAFMKVKKMPLQFPNLFSKDFFNLLCAIVISVAGVLFYYLAIGAGSTAIVAPIAGSYPTLMVFLSFVFLKEKLSKQQIAGIIITLCGIVALSFLSV